MMIKDLLCPILICMFIACAYGKNSCTARISASFTGAQKNLLCHDNPESVYIPECANEAKQKFHLKFEEITKLCAYVDKKFQPIPCYRHFHGWTKAHRHSRGGEPAQGISLCANASNILPSMCWTNIQELCSRFPRTVQSMDHLCSSPSSIISFCQSSTVKLDSVQCLSAMVESQFATDTTVTAIADSCGKLTPRTSWSLFTFHDCLANIENLRVDKKRQIQSWDLKNTIQFCGNMVSSDTANTTEALECFRSMWAHTGKTRNLDANLVTEALSTCAWSVDGVSQFQCLKGSIVDASVPASTCIRVTGNGDLPLRCLQQAHSTLTGASKSLIAELCQGTDSAETTTIRVECAKIFLKTGAVATVPLLCNQVESVKEAKELSRWVHSEDHWVLQQREDFKEELFFSKEIWTSLTVSAQLQQLGLWSADAFESLFETTDVVLPSAECIQNIQSFLNKFPWTTGRTTPFKWEENSKITVSEAIRTEEQLVKQGAARLCLRNEVLSHKARLMCLQQLSLKYSVSEALRLCRSPQFSVDSSLVSQQLQSTEQCISRHRGGGWSFMELIHLCADWTPRSATTPHTSVVQRRMECANYVHTTMGYPKSWSSVLCRHERPTNQREFGFKGLTLACLQAVYPKGMNSIVPVGVLAHVCANKDTSMIQTATDRGQCLYELYNLHKDLATSLDSMDSSMTTLVCANRRWKSLLQCLSNRPEAYSPLSFQQCLNDTSSNIPESIDHVRIISEDNDIRITAGKQFQLFFDLLDKWKQPVDLGTDEYIVTFTSLTKSVSVLGIPRNVTKSHQVHFSSLLVTTPGLLKVKVMIRKAGQQISRELSQFSIRVLENEALNGLDFCQFAFDHSMCHKDISSSEVEEMLPSRMFWLPIHYYTAALACASTLESWGISATTDPAGVWIVYRTGVEAIWKGVEYINDKELVYLPSLTDTPLTRLGLDEGVTHSKRSIRKAYYKMSQLWHPDKWQAIVRKGENMRLGIRSPYTIIINSIFEAVSSAYTELSGESL